MSVHEVATGQGPARVHVTLPDSSPGSAPVGAAPVGRLVLGHGAGGGLGAPDLVAARTAAVAAGWAVALVEQPWKVAGKKIAGRPPTLDEAWLEVLAALPALPGLSGAEDGAGLLVVGGRSAGARVACRTATATGADGVLCLAFPLHLPGKPEKSRAEELNAPGVPVLVVQGEADPFGGPDELEVALAVRTPSSRRLVTLLRVPGNHSLTASGRRVDPAVGPAVAGWLASFAGG